MKKVQIQPATPQERHVLANLMQLYLYDLSEYEEGSVDSRGLFRPDEYFDRYWTEAGRHPFLIRVDGRLAGFALVREVEPGTVSVAEFFILRGRRRVGVGAAAAIGLFDLFRGTWRVAEQERNLPAQLFWRRVIGQYTDGKFSEEWSKGEPCGPMQVFDNQAKE
jgi:predicted acetyltransferase